MGRFRKRGAREIVWGPEEPWVEPKREVVLGPAGYAGQSNSGENSGESALGFLGAMASSAEPSSSSSSGVSESERPRSQYGWDPTASGQSNTIESNSSMSSDHIERIERLHRKMERMSEQIEFLQKKLEMIENKLGIN